MQSKKKILMNFFVSQENYVWVITGCYRWCLRCFDDRRRRVESFWKLNLFNLFSTPRVKPKKMLIFPAVSWVCVCLCMFCVCVLCMCVYVYVFLLLFGNLSIIYLMKVLLDLMEQWFHKMLCCADILRPFLKLSRDLSYLWHKTASFSMFSVIKPQNIHHCIIGRGFLAGLSEAFADTRTKKNFYFFRCSRKKFYTHKMFTVNLYPCSCDFQFHALNTFKYNFFFGGVSFSISIKEE